MPYVGGRLPEFLARIKGDVQMRHPALIGRLGTFVAELDAEDDAAILAGGCDPDITFERFPILRSSIARQASIQASASFHQADQLWESGKR